MKYHREQLFGSWYNTNTDEKGIQTSEYAELAADGSFEITFLTFDDKGELCDKVIELGDWGLVGDIHFTITKSELIAQELYAADLGNSDNYHAYRVLQLDKKCINCAGSLILSAIVSAVLYRQELALARAKKAAANTWIVNLLTKKN